MVWGDAVGTEEMVWSNQYQSDEACKSTGCAKQYLLKQKGGTSPETPRELKWKLTDSFSGVDPHWEDLQHEVTEETACPGWCVAHTDNIWEGIKGSCSGNFDADKPDSIAGTKCDTEGEKKFCGLWAKWILMDGVTGATGWPKNGEYYCTCYSKGYYWECSAEL